MQPRSNYTVIYMTFRDVTRGVPENVRWWFFTKLTVPLLLRILLILYY
jgi:hypothetical protein